MEQKYIKGDVVMYDNKIMVVKEPRDGSHFDLSCPQERLVYCFVSVVDIVPIPITHKILCKNEWKANAIEYDYSIKDKLYFRAFTDYKTGGVVLEVYTNIAPSDSYDVCQDDFYLGDISYVHQLQHLLFGLGLNSEMEV